jgi:putative phosphoribosyl transferase
VTARFQDRRSAGRELANAVQRLELENPIVLALPRGGVPVAFEIACTLEAPLDLLLVRKLGAPGQPEFGIGAIADGLGHRTFVDPEVVESLGVSADYLQQEIERQTIELERRRRAYRGSMPPMDTSRRHVVVVDDGIATGATIRVALDALRSNEVATITLAVPVAPLEALVSLQLLADEVICLSFPEPFLAVGNHYERFDQTSDEEVMDLLARANSDRAEGS